ncbi:hypothetical protein LINPERHAP2_LOCUS9484 [Linum perenne]
MTMSEGPPSLTWPLTSSANYSVSSFNFQLRSEKFSGMDNFPHDTIWRKMVPVKI